MTLKGQWITRYSGTNIGTAVLDLDEYENHFVGTGVAWEDSLALPSAMIKIVTPSKSGTQNLKGIPVVALDGIGNRLSAEALQQLQKTTGRTMPATVDIDLQLNGDRLSIGWKSSIGTSGVVLATASKTRANLPSELVPTVIRGGRDSSGASILLSRSDTYSVVRRTTDGVSELAFTEPEGQTLTGI